MDVLTSRSPIPVSSWKPGEAASMSCFRAQVDTGSDGRSSRQKLARVPSHSQLATEGNGHKDLVALTATSRQWSSLGNGKGSFTRENMPPRAFPGACRGAHVELADLDGDGKDELVASFSDEHDQYGHCQSDGGLIAWKARPRTGVAKP
jgi:VCBS repeat protein